MQQYLEPDPESQSRRRFPRWLRRRINSSQHKLREGQGILLAGSETDDF